MILNTERGCILKANSLKGSVVEVDVCHLDVLFVERINVDAESVVLRCDLHLSGAEVLNRVIASSVTKRHLERFRSSRQREDLVPKADAENRHFTNELFDIDSGVFDRLRIARAIGEHYAVGIEGQNFFSGGLGWHNRYLASLANELPQNATLDAEIVYDDLKRLFYVWTWCLLVLASAKSTSRSLQ